MMKKLIIIIFTMLILSTQLVWAADWYVTQDGDGDLSGQPNVTNAMPVATFNALTGDKSGYTYYFSGPFTTRIEVLNIEGSSGQPVTLDGYQVGDCDPINSVCSSSALLLQGMEIGGNITGPDYINVYDFRMTRTNSYNACFTIYGDVSEGDDEAHCDYINVKRNYIYETYGTMFYYYSGRYSTVENNKFYVFGQGGTDATQGVNLTQVDDFIFRGNEVGHNESSYPSGCSSAEMIEIHGSFRVLIELNDVYGAPTQSGIRPKEDGGGVMEDIIIRFNKVHDNLNETSGTTQGKGIYPGTRDTQSISNVYIYGNLLYNNSAGNIMASVEVDHLYIWSNILLDSGRSGIIIFTKTGETAPDYVYIYNNTIARNNTSDETDNSRGGIIITAGSNINIINNILWNNRSTGAGSKYNQIYSDITPTSLDFNTYWTDADGESPGADLFYYSSAMKTLSEMVSQTAFCDDGEETDAPFTNGDSDNFTLTAATTAGADLGGNIGTVTIQGTTYCSSGCDELLSFAVALDPDTTDWTTTPPTIGITDRDVEGWSRGAYSYPPEPAGLPPAIRMFYLD